MKQYAPVVVPDAVRQRAVCPSFRLPRSRGRSGGGPLPRQRKRGGANAAIRIVRRVQRGRANAAIRIVHRVQCGGGRSPAKTRHAVRPSPILSRNRERGFPWSRPVLSAPHFRLPRLRGGPHDKA